MVNTCPTIPGLLSLLAIVLGYEDFICSDECFNMKLDGDYSMTSEDQNATMEERKKTNMADFLFTAPCPPIWNFTLACNYFSRKTISCEESTAILKRCLQHYDSYIPCNTTIDVIERCMEENTTMCEGLFDLYNNYCYNTCRSYCEEVKEMNFRGNNTRTGITLSGLSKRNNSGGVSSRRNNTSDTVVEYFSKNGHFVNISDGNNTHIKIIRVKGVRKSENNWTCGILCIILLIGGSFLLIGLLGSILFCVIKRYHKDENSYKVHSQDKCVGPDDCGIRADSALLPGMNLKEEIQHIPRRYRNTGVQDTSFIHIQHYPHCSSRLLRGTIPTDDIEDREF